MKYPCIVSLDVGGTYIKYGVLHDGVLIDGVEQTPSHACSTADEVLAALRVAVEAACLRANKQEMEPTCLAVAFPGPFDYERGIPMMTHKFRSLYGMSITPTLAEALPTNTRIEYLHDSTAFMLGEAYYGAAKGTLRPAGIMIGTGLGFAFMQEGKVCISRDQRPSVRIWNMPFANGILEDVISAHGLERTYETLSGKHASAQQISELAYGGNNLAKETYRTVGNLIGEGLKPILEELQCDRLVIGGQVSRSASLFVPYINVGIPVCQAKGIESSALYGAYVYAQLGKNKSTFVIEEKELLSIR